jgi:protein-L-isoaspartate(D-aspartate) O-methyltransferase
MRPAPADRDVSPDVRRRFAEELEYRAHVRSPRLVQAFADVPRDRFVGAGPWRLRRELVAEYGSSADANPAHLCHDVMVALDEPRQHDNGLPSLWALLIDRLAPQQGERVVHVGAGTGYYSAILAEMVGPAGQVTAIECDAALAARAAANLAERANVVVVHGDGSLHQPGQADLIVVNAGVTSPPAIWLDGLRPGGRLLLPLTLDDRQGAIFLITRRGDDYEARVLRGIEIFPCASARDLEGDARLRVASWKRSPTCVRFLRRDGHEVDAACWLHADSFCLSAKPVGVG